MVRRAWLLALLAVGSTAFGATAEEKEKIRIERHKRTVTITVTDPSGKPIPNAWVRVPETDGRRAVDPQSGKWETDLLYKLDGTEYWFLKGKPIDFMISAPQYQTASLLFKVHGRKSNNNLLVSLQPMEKPDLGNDDELMIQWFKRTNTETAPTASAPK
jgi:hypothetical protein